MRRERLVVVYNPKGGGADQLDDVRKALTGQGVDAEWIATTKDDPGAGMARKAVADGASAVIAAGGDGTVRSCAEGLLGSSVPLGVIPTGTGNLLARGLEIPLDVAGAVEVALTGNEQTLDVGLANDEPFVVMAGMGLDARMIEDSDRKLKSKVGPLAYVVSASRHLRRGPFAVRLLIDGARTRSVRATMVLVGNLGELPGGVSPFPTADPADGLLEVLVIRESGVLGWLRALFAILSGGSRGRVLRSTVSELNVRTRSRQPYEIDGEERGRTRQVDFKVRPASLVCIVPNTE